MRTFISFFLTVYLGIFSLHAAQADPLEASRYRQKALRQESYAKNLGKMTQSQKAAIENLLLYPAEIMIQGRLGPKAYKDRFKEAVVDLNAANLGGLLSLEKRERAPLDDFNLKYYVVSHMAAYVLSEILLPDYVRSLTLYAMQNVLLNALEQDHATPNRDDFRFFVDSIITTYQDMLHSTKESLQANPANYIQNTDITAAALARILFQVARIRFKNYEGIEFLPDAEDRNYPLGIAIGGGLDLKFYTISRTIVLADGSQEISIKRFSRLIGTLEQQSFMYTLLLEQNTPPAPLDLYLRRILAVEGAGFGDDDYIPFPPPKGEQDTRPSHAKAIFYEKVSAFDYSDRYMYPFSAVAPAPLTWDPNHRRRPHGTDLFAYIGIDTNLSQYKEESVRVHAASGVLDIWNALGYARVDPRNLPVIPIAVRPEEHRPAAAPRIAAPMAVPPGVLAEELRQQRRAASTEEIDRLVVMCKRTVSPHHIPVGHNFPDRIGARAKELIANNANLAPMDVIQQAMNEICGNPRHRSRLLNAFLGRDLG